MSDLASISDEWWHGAGKPVEATAMAKKLKAPNPFYHLRGGDYWWGDDEDVYYDPEGNPISKEDYEKQFQNQDKSPVEPDLPDDLPEQPQFVGDPTQFKPMPFDPTNPLMYMGSGSPFYHMRGGFSQEHIDMLARAGQALYGDLTPEKVMSGAIDGIQEFFKTPEQKEAEKRQKEEEERIQKEKEEREKGSWSSILSPFFHLSGGAIDKYIATAKEFAKRAGYKDWDSLRRADDGEHKLELRGVKFGRKGYGDFIKYSLEKGVDEAQKHRSAYLSRATKIKGDWAKDMYSPNSLAIKILWGGGYSGGMKSETELEDMSVVKLIDYGKSLGIKGLDGKTKKVIIDKILNHKETVKTPDVVDEWAEEREKAYNLLIDQPLDELKKLAKEEKITRIPHKNKEKLARELANKYVDDALEQALNPPKPRITDPDDDDFEGVEYSREDMRRQREAQAEQAKAETLLKKRMRRQANKPKAWNQEAYEKSLGLGKPVLAPQDVLEGKKDNPVVEEIIEEPMDDGDIRQYLPNAKVIRYSGLSRISDIEQLLPTDKSYVILLYENTPGSGHWVALMRYGNTIEFFCSYGSKIDAPLRWQNPKDNAMLGQTAPFLSQLLNKAKGKFRAIHNPVAYQSSKQGVATCGAWDVMRINQMKNHNQDLQEFHNFMESVKKETGLTYDEIVVNYVSKR